MVARQWHDDDSRWESATGAVARLGGARRGALVLTCVVGLLAGSAAEGAHAAPAAPGSDGQRADSGGDGRAGGADSDSRADADEPADESSDETAGEDADEDGERRGGGEESRDGAGLESVRKQIEKLHDRAGSATDAYNAAEAKAKRQRKQVSKLNRKVESTEREMRELRRTAGAMARAQYRGGGMPDEARLMLTHDPDSFLHDMSVARKGHQATRGFLAELSGTRAELSEYRQGAKKKWKRLEKHREQKAAAKKKIEGQLKKAEKLESALQGEELKELRKLEDKAAQRRQAEWLESGVLDRVSGSPSQAGKRAIAYASEQLGKDYEWGAEGPKTFDCSGLTLRAWQAAGEGIPRTSQEQWKRLPRVPIEKMRPGDLIIYKRDASHVGMYVGDGKMLHAPRTGRQITVEGAGSLPILGVVRPDK